MNTKLQTKQYTIIITNSMIIFLTLFLTDMISMTLLFGPPSLSSFCNPCSNTLSMKLFDLFTINPCLYSGTAGKSSFKKHLTAETVPCSSAPWHTRDIGWHVVSSASLQAVATSTRKYVTSFWKQSGVEI